MRGVCSIFARRALAVLAALWPVVAQAARPLVTDDARLTDARSCQLESWTRVYPDRVEVWALPACNPTGGFEISAGVGHSTGGAQGASSDFVLQGKTLLRTLKTDDWGIGIAAGLVTHPSVNPGPNGLGSIYAYVPVSVSLAGNRLVLHGNLGWIKARGDGHAISWGLGSETKVTQRLTVIAEAFGDPRSKPYWQAGGRYFLVPERVQVDATIGQRLGEGGATRWFSIGLRVTPERLF